MKILIVGLLVFLTVGAGTSVADQSFRENGATVTVRTVCEKGQEYVITTVQYNGKVGVSTVQVYKGTSNGKTTLRPPQPVRCK